jgi:hypothetical protein
MRLTAFPAALAATLLFATSSGFGGTWATVPWAGSSARACTADMQKCLEKLEARLQLHGHSLDRLDIERALLELNESDPECALRLRSAGLFGF